MRPHVLLVDSTSSTTNGWIVDALTANREVGIVVIASSRYEPGDLLAHFEAGVRGVLEATESRADLLEIVHAVARGEARWPTQMIATLLRQVAVRAARQHATRSDGRLTARELEVFRLVDEGLSNKQIAAKLHIEVATVKHHVHNILEKLSVARRGEAVAVGRRTGLLSRPT
jgi:DNA-binding NarL/FixJ family response regulator